MSGDEQGHEVDATSTVSADCVAPTPRIASSRRLPKPPSGKGPRVLQQVPACDAPDIWSQFRTERGVSAHAVPTLRVALWACIVASAVTIPVGDFSIGLHVFLILTAWLAVSRTRQAAQASGAPAVGILYALLIGHFLFVQLTTPCTDLQLKSAASLLLTLLLVAAVVRLAAQPHAQPLTADLKAIVAVVTVSIVMDLALGLTSADAAVMRAGGIYPEPSHLALAVAPALVGLMGAEGAANRLWGWAGFIAMSILSASATLFTIVTLCFIMALLAQSKKQLPLSIVLRVLLMLGFILTLVLNSPYVDEFASRIAGFAQVDASSNLSSLVYINGWETALQNLQATYGVGLGFNRMGCEPRPESDSGALLEYLGVSDQNYNDGSFIMAKLLSELGFLGLTFWASALLVLVRLVFIKSRQPLAHLPRDVQAMLVSGITIITLGALIRGTNYLSGSYLFGLFCLLFVLAQVRRARQARAKLAAASPAAAKPQAQGDHHV